MINPRLDSLNDYPFARLRGLLGSVTPPAGIEPAVMSVGEPQHEPPPFVAEILAANAAIWNKYPPVDGTPDFRRAIADWLTRRYRLAPGRIDPDRHVLPLSGTREGLFMVGLLATARRKNGKAPVALIPNPFYQAYLGAATMAGAETRFLPSDRRNDFLPDLDGVDAETLVRTAMAFICTPSNPEGAVASVDYLKHALDLARRNDIVLAVDECYAEIYGATPPPGALEATTEGDDFANLLVFHSLSKRSSVPGLRSGFVAGDANLIAAFKRLRDYSAASVPGPVQAASAALWREESHVQANRTLYRAKFDAAERIIGKRLGFYRPDGGFYLWLDVGDGEAAAKRLWAEAAIRVMPGAYLARTDEAGRNPGQRFIRVALVHKPDAVETALKRLVKVL
ncbi:MAG: aminotransferase class I/II-fold pyridoxal phosphate-dependent enzyme [Rhodospirillales bacterium]|nr:aminotransferase class I/II-fold pyridoxal phosphate-dependent enzyme [Rhodospirillales bacterium]